MSLPTEESSSKSVSRAGYRVETAEDGAEALKQLEAFHPDLIILDYMMPGLSGMDVLRELRRREDDTPVIMVTAYGNIERAVEAMHEGAYDFITRPFKPEHITHVVQKALERQRLKRGIEILSEEVGERYQLVVGASVRMKQAVDLAEKDRRQQRHCFAPRRKRHGQRDLRPLHPQLECASGQTVYRNKLGRTFQGASRERVVWLRARRIHWSSAAQKR